MVSPRTAKLDYFPPIAKALETNNYLFVFFTSANCSVCTKFKPILSEVIKNYPWIKVLQLSIEDYPKMLRQKFGVVFVPTLALYDPSGKALHRSVGFMKSTCLTKVLEKTQDNTKKEQQ